MKKEVTQISLRISKGLLDEIERMAKEELRTRTGMVLKLLAEAIKNRRQK